MHKIKNNAAEIVITAMTVVTLLSSCGTMVDMVATCPAYASGVTEEMLGEDMYANQSWCNDEQGRQNYVFINY